MFKNLMPFACIATAYDSWKEQFLRSLLWLKYHQADSSFVSTGCRQSAVVGLYFEALELKIEVAVVKAMKSRVLSRNDSGVHRIPPPLVLTTAARFDHCLDLDVGSSAPLLAAISWSHLISCIQCREKSRSTREMDGPLTFSSSSTRSALLSIFSLLPLIFDISFDYSGTA